MNQWLRWWVGDPVLILIVNYISHLVVGIWPEIAPHSHSVILTGVQCTA